MPPIRTRLALTLTGFSILLAAALVAGPLIGSDAHLADARLRSIDRVRRQHRRADLLRRASAAGLAAALVGASLAAAGVVFQALLRNPLATPDTLGVSSGAALGAMLAITFHVDFAVAGVASIPLASFAGSIGALGNRLPRWPPRAAAASRRSCCCWPA